MSDPVTDREPVGDSMATALRIVVAIGWLVVALVMLRIAWGGWSGGVVYVVQVEPTIAVIAGSAMIIMASGLVVAMAISRAHRTSQASAAGAILALLYGLFLLIDGHMSGGLIVGVSVLILLASLRLAARPEEPRDP